MRVRTPLTLLALLLVLAAGLQAKKKDNWVELRSSHFHIVTNAKPKKAEQVAHQLEEFRHLLGLFFPFLQLDPPAPARVLLFKNKKSFRPYQPLTPEGKPDKASGFMQPGRERMFLAVDLGTRHATQTAYHEYIHLLLRLNFADLPVWLNEGMAEFYEHTEIDGKDFKLGDWSPGWWRVLQRRGLLPVEVMANADRRSSYYNVPKRRQLFYAQSWLVVHYIMVGDKGKRQPELNRFVDLLRRDVPQDEAFRQAFGTSYAGFRKPLQDYLRRRTLSRYQGTMKEKVERTPLEAAPLTEAQAQAFLTDLWLNQGRLEEAEKALAGLAASDPDEPEVLTRLGRIASLRGRHEEAERHLRRALAARPDDVGLRYYTALALSQGRLLDSEEEEKSALAGEVVELLEPLLQQENDFPYAFELLLQARLARNDSPEALIPVLEQARERMPQHRDFDLLLAQLYFQVDRLDDAEKLWQLVVKRSTDSIMRQQEEDSLERLQRFRKAAPEATLQVSAAPREPGTSSLTRPVEPPPAPRPAGPPKVSYLRGTLVEIACAGEGAVLRIEPRKRKGGSGGPVRLAVPSLERALVLDPTESGAKLACGAAHLPVAINYRVEPQEPGIAGVVITVEFHPPDL